MTRAWLALLLIACARQHGAALQEVTPGACVTCHRADYDATADPPHAGQMPTTCADCHVMTAWRPALGGGHPELDFPIASGAHQVPCLGCHDLALGPSSGGQNTSCIRCHAQAQTDPLHRGIATYGYDAGAPHFCLDCHPHGTAAKHNESAFPITFGHHSGIACVDCHDATLGGYKENPNCTGCHTGAHARALMDEHHRQVPGYRWSDSDKQFCRTCHPRGLNAN